MIVENKFSDCFIRVCVAVGGQIRIICKFECYKLSSTVSCWTGSKYRLLLIKMNLWVDVSRILWLLRPKFDSQRKHWTMNCFLSIDLIIKFKNEWTNYMSFVLSQYFQKYIFEKKKNKCISNSLFIIVGYFLQYNIMLYIHFRVYETRHLFADRSRTVRTVWSRTSVRASHPHGAGSFQSSKSSRK